MKNWHYLLLTCSLIVWLLCNNLWPYTEVEIYYFGIAQVIFVSSVIIHQQPKDKKWKKLISASFVFLSLNNLLDEMFFNPQAFDASEYISVIAYLIYFIWKTYRNG